MKNKRHVLTWVLSFRCSQCWDGGMETDTDANKLTQNPIWIYVGIDTSAQFYTTYYLLVSLSVSVSDSVNAIPLPKGPFTPSVCINAVMTLAILFSLKTMDSLQIGVATHLQVTPLFSMRTELLASSKSCRSIDPEAWCKRALTVSCFWGQFEWMIDTSNFFKFSLI